MKLMMDNNYQDRYLLKTSLHFAVNYKSHENTDFPDFFYDFHDICLFPMELAKPGANR